MDWIIDKKQPFPSDELTDKPFDHQELCREDEQETPSRFDSSCAADWALLKWALLKGVKTSLFGDDLITHCFFTKSIQGVVSKDLQQMLALEQAYAAMKTSIGVDHILNDAKNNVRSFPGTHINIGNLTNVTWPSYSVLNPSLDMWPSPSLEYFSPATVAIVWCSTALGTVSSRHMYGHDLSHSAFVAAGTLTVVIAAALRGQKKGLACLIYHYAPFGVVCGLICFGALVIVQKLFGLFKKPLKYRKDHRKRCTVLYHQNSGSTDDAKKTNGNHHDSADIERTSKDLA